MRASWRGAATITLGILASFVSSLGVSRSSSAYQPARAPGDGWHSLFDGETLNGWETTGHPAGWLAEDGLIHCLAKKGGYLYTVGEYDDFELKAEFKYDRGANSGIFVRWANLKDPVHSGIEVQVFDSYGRETAGKHDSGAIYDLVPPTRNLARPVGEWNQAHIVCDGPNMTADLNGERVSSINLDQYTVAGQSPDGSKNKFRYALKDFARRGHIGLQDHGARTWFRRIMIRPIEK